MSMWSDPIPDTSPPPARRVTLPYQTPGERTLTTARREAIQAGVLIALTGLSKLVGEMITNDSLSYRTTILICVGILTKAAITVTMKWDRTTKEVA